MRTHTKRGGTIVSKAKFSEKKMKLGERSEFRDWPADETGQRSRADGTSGQTAMEHMRAIDERTLALFIRPRAIRSGLQKALERWTAH